MVLNLQKKSRFQQFQVEERRYVSHRYSDEGIKITVMSQICILLAGHLKSLLHSS